MTENPLSPPRSSLPPASLLAKFKAFDPNAPEWIMAKAETIGTERRARELRETVRRSFLRKDFWLAVLQGMALAFDPLPRPTRIKTVESSRLVAGNDWIAVGNDMRAAMKAYIAEGYFDERQLTEAERDELEMVKPFPLPSFGNLSL